MKKHSDTVFSIKTKAGQLPIVIAATAIGISVSFTVQSATADRLLLPPCQTSTSPEQPILKTGNRQMQTFSFPSLNKPLVAKSNKKSDNSSSKSNSTKEDKSDSKADAKPTPLPPIENVIDVTTNQLVDKPQDFLNKNVKFTAKFFAYNSLALDYKPAMRSSRTNLSFLVLRPEAHIPFAELKLAMPLPKEKDPETLLLASLKEGDQIEVIGKVFATPLDEPWVDVLRMKKLSSADDKKDDKKLSANETDAIKKENAPELDGTVKGKMLPDKGHAFPPDTRSKDINLLPDKTPTEPGKHLVLPSGSQNIKEHYTDTPADPKAAGPQPEPPETPNTHKPIVPY